MKYSTTLISLIAILLSAFTSNSQNEIKSSYLSLGIGQHLVKTSFEDFHNDVFSANYVYQFKSGKIISFTTDYFLAYGSNNNNFQLSSNYSSNEPNVTDRSSYESVTFGAHAYLFSTKVDKTWKSHARIGLSVEHFHEYKVDRVGHEPKGIGVFGQPIYSYYTLETDSKKGLTLGLPMAYVLNFHPLSSAGLSLIVGVTPKLNNRHEASASLMIDLGRLRDK